MKCHWEIACYNVCCYLDCDGKQWEREPKRDRKRKLVCEVSKSVRYVLRLNEIVYRHKDSGTLSFLLCAFFVLCVRRVFFDISIVFFYLLHWLKETQSNPQKHHKQTITHTAEKKKQTKRKAEKRGNLLISPKLTLEIKILELQNQIEP